jgi:hypothetical protein
MNTRLTELNILGQATQKLCQATGLIVEVKGHPVPVAGQKGMVDPDATLHIRLPKSNKPFQLAAEVKKGPLQRAMIGLMAQHSNRSPEQGILVTRYVPPNWADELRELNIQFMDMAGNAFINAPTLYVFIKGNKLDKAQRPEPPGRAFRRAGLQVIFAMLCEPGLEKLPFREIAKITQVALGTVGTIMGDLRNLGYLLDMGARGRRLTKKEKLLERWLTAYPEQLRHKQVLGRYRIGDRNQLWNVDNIKLLDHAYWGGEVAAAKMTQYLKAKIATIYVAGPPEKLIIKNRMQKDPHGDIEIIKTFWDDQGLPPQGHEDMVPPLLVYADLLTTGDPRNIETAKLIYEQNIVRLIRED